jgi:hypothetical protein
MAVGESLEHVSRTDDMLADDFHVNADALKKIVDDLVLYGLISNNENKTEL